MVGKALALLLTVAAVASGAAPAGAARRGPAPSASLAGFVCRPAFSPRDRMIEVTATMRPAAGSDRMEMRFQLLERLPGAAFRVVHGGDLGRWLPEPPASGQTPVAAWVVRKPVLNLYAPASYRFRVTFRWLEQSVVVTSETRVSAVCAQS